MDFTIKEREPLRICGVPVPFIKRDGEPVDPDGGQVLLARDCDELGNIGTREAVISEQGVRIVDFYAGIVVQETEVIPFSQASTSPQLRGRLRVIPR